MKELLFLSHRIPYPPNKGDKIRSFNLLKYLARHYRVHLGTFVDDPEDWKHLPALREICGETRFVPLQPSWAKLRSLTGLLRGEPLTLAYYRDRRLADWVAHLLSQRPLHGIVVFSSAMAQYLPAALPKLRRIVDFVDVDSDKWRQYSTRHRWPLSWLYRREADTLLQFERQQAAAADVSIFVTEAEAALFRQCAPEAAARVTFVENGVNAEYFRPDPGYPNPYAAGERVLVFTGAMDYWANVDAVTWFAHEVFPRVFADNPSARFYIVGSRPAEPVQRLAQLPGVRVTGTVKDIRPYLAHAAAAVAPLRIARGVQNKVLEALAMAKPVLATSHAVDGLKPWSEFAWLVADEATVMARRAVELLDGSDQADLGRRGREYVLANYNWDRNLQRLEQFLEGEIPTSPRCGNASLPATSTAART
jgi:sugar transferase (PEP-CTERM/EpsH1 system associated)